MIEHLRMIALAPMWVFCAWGWAIGSAIGLLSHRALGVLW